MNSPMSHCVAGGIVYGCRVEMLSWKGRRVWRGEEGAGYIPPSALEDESTASVRVGGMCQCGRALCIYCPAAATCSFQPSGPHAPALRVVLSDAVIAVSVVVVDGLSSGWSLCSSDRVIISHM